MKSVDFLYFIEHKARELDVACAVKYFLHFQYNISVEICSIVVDLEYTLMQFQPKVVVLPYCVSIKSLNIEKIIEKWPDAKYIDLAYEQLLGNAQKKFKAPADDFARKYVVHQAWGEFFKDFLIKSGVPGHNIFVNGNPSYALYQEPYNNFYGDPRTSLSKWFDLHPEKRWIFVPENYGWAFFENHMLRDRIKRGFDPIHAYSYRDFAVESLRTATEWWCAGAVLDDVELIIRPRPAIPREMFIEKIQGLVGSLPDQLHIIKDGSVREWILASDIVLSSISTTLLEAAIANKSLYMLMPYAIPEFIHVEWNDLAPKIKSEDKFLSILSQPVLEPNWGPLESWIVEKMLNRGDPITNQVTFFVSVLNGDIHLPALGEFVKRNIRSPLSKAMDVIRKSAWKFYERSKYQLGLKSKSQRWEPHQMDLIEVDEVEQKVSRWQEVLA